MAEGVTIGDFRGDYEDLERMAHASWRDEYGEASFPNFYRPAFLRHLFERIPAGKRDHLIAAYRGDAIAGFLANIPQSFQLRGSLYRGAYSCLMVTRKESLRQGLAMALVRKALEVNKTHKYDFVLLTLETGHRSTKMMDKLRAEGNRLEWVRKSGVIARILDLPRVAHSEGLKSYEKAVIRLWGSHRPPRPAGRSAIPLREYRPSDLDDCLELLDAYRNSVTLSLVWDREELGWELACPDVSRTLVYERDGRVAGLVNFLAHDHLGRTTERWAWVNHLAYPGLTKAERFEFVQAYLRTIRDEGFVGTVEWKRNYYPMDAFRRSRFFPYPRAVNLVSWTFNPALSLARIPDVYEIQI